MNAPLVIKSNPMLFSSPESLSRNKNRSKWHKAWTQGPLGLLLVLMLCSAQSWAADVCTQDNDLARDQVTESLTNGRDSLGFGEPLGGWNSRTFTVTCSQIIPIDALKFAAIAEDIGLTSVDGNQYKVKRNLSNENELGQIFEVKINEATFPIADNASADGNYESIDHPNVSPSDSYTITLRWRMVGSDTVVNSYTTEGAIESGIVVGGFYHPYAYLISYDIKSTAASCTLPGDLSVKMPQIAASRFTGVGSTVDTGQAISFQIDCPPSTRGLTVEATLTDANKGDNLSAALSTISGPNEATGVGIQLLKPNSSEPILYGAKSSDRNNINQFELFQVGPAGGNGNIISLPVKLVQTAEKITPGKINAQAIITLSFQ